jgi:hypothetical protein
MAQNEHPTSSMLHLMSGSVDTRGRVGFERLDMIQYERPLEVRPA